MTYPSHSMGYRLLISLQDVVPLPVGYATPRPPACSTLPRCGQNREVSPSKDPVTPVN